MNVTLLNIECLSSAKAIEAILEKNHKKIKLLITTDPNKGSLKFFLSQVFLHTKRSGLTYVSYLFCNFILHRILVSSSYTLAKIKKTQSPYTPFLEICKKLGIRYLRVNDVNDPQVLKILKELNIDLVTVYNFDQILKEPFIQFPKHGVINFHAAPLPECRGLHPIVYCAAKNNRQFAVTAHEITDRKIDAGAILGQTQIFKSQEQDIFQLEEKVNLSGVDLYTHVLENFQELRKTKYIQDPGSYYSHPSRADMCDFKKKGYQFIAPKKHLQRYFQIQPQRSSQRPDR